MHNIEAVIWKRQALERLTDKGDAESQFALRGFIVCLAENPFRDVNSNTIVSPLRDFDGMFTCAATRVEKNRSRTGIEVAHETGHDLIIEPVLDRVGSVNAYPFLVDLARRESFFQVHDAF